ncbi:glycosyltransferase family 4 protein [Janibacter anophelis]|uniref:glycosyltransferase family 4 protein n=1 Tax=Janibacter anophelis TaxID=319054 RepID=UPI003F81999A
MSPIDMSSVKTQGKRAARAAVHRVPLDRVAALRNQGGRMGRRAVFAQARLLVLMGGRPEDGLALLGHLPQEALGATGHAFRASCHHELGETEEALREAEATLELRPDAEALGVAMSVAQRIGHEPLIRRANALAATTTPRRTVDAERLLVTYRSHVPAETEAFLANAATWTVDHSANRLERIGADTEIRSAGDLTLQRARALEVGLRGGESLIVAARHLRDAQGWDELRELWQHLSPAELEIISDKTAVGIADLAARAGWLDTAQIVAQRTIDKSGNPKARRTHARAADQTQIARTGWPVDVAADTPAYEPRPGSILAVLAQSLPHRSGGYATRGHGILTSLQSMDWDILAVTRLGFPYDFWKKNDPREVEDQDVVDGLTYRRLLEPKEREYLTTPMASYIERFATRIEDVAREHRASLIQASSFQNNGLAGLRAARRLGIPFVYEMRGLEDLMKVSRNPAFVDTDAHAYMTGLELHIVQQADLTFVITEALREEMIRRGGPADRIKVLPNGVHADQFQPRQPDAALIDELGIHGKTVIGYAGSLVDYEGLDLLLAAVARLKASRDDFAVIIVGDGGYESYLHRLARELDILDVVTFTGRVPHEEVARYLSIFQITPFPRLPLPVCELISPIKPFEAMAMGKACISSSVAALTEIVEADVRGLVFEKGDADDFARQLTRYLDDPQLRETMGRQAREWVLGERDWRKVTRIADAAYEQLLGHPHGRSSAESPATSDAPAAPSADVPAGPGPQTAAG